MPRPRGSAPGHASRSQSRRARDAWRTLVPGLRRLLEVGCPGAESEVVGYGNLLAAIGMMLGVAAEELRPDEIAVNDLEYPVVVCACVRKPLPGESP